MFCYGYTCTAPIYTADTGVSPIYMFDIGVLPMLTAILISFRCLYTLYTYMFYMLFTNLTKLIRGTSEKCDNSLLLVTLIG